MRPLRPAFFVPFWMLICAGIYLFIAQVKQMPSGDETISFLCASGHQEAYEQVTRHNPPYGCVSQASSWQDYLRVEHQRFQHIAHNLTLSDLHPPLYFWMLHYAMRVWSNPLQAGLILNLLLHLCSLLLLHVLFRRLQLSPTAQLLGLALWSLSPAIIGTGLYARQYELLGLCGLGAVFTFIAYRNNGNYLWWLLHLACLLAGILTQYLFVYYMPVFALYLLIAEHRTKQALWLSGAMVLSLFMLFIIHPGVIQQFALQQSRAQAFNLHEIPLRLGKTLLAFIQVWLPVLELKPWLMQLSPVKLFGAVALAIVIAGVGLRFILRNKNKGIPHNETPSLITFSRWWLMYTLCLSILPYWLFLTPRHAMGGPYLMLVYPALLVYMLPFLQHYTRMVITLTGMGTILWLAGFTRQQNTYFPLTQALKQTDVVVVTSADRRGFLRVVNQLPAQTIVYMHARPNLCQWPGKKILLLSDEATHAGVDSLLQGAVTYPLLDGVTFYAKEFTSISCDSSRGQ